MALSETPRMPQGVSLTFLGQSTFIIETVKAARILIDPFVGSNPVSPVKNEDIGKIDLIIVTHPHADHFADCVPIAKAANCPVVATPEVLAYLKSKGVEKQVPVNKGGTVEFDDLGFSVSLTHADHTSGITGDNGETIYGGEPMGLMLHFPDHEDTFTIYHAGDTAVFGDMRLLSEIYLPTIALLPIGDNYTMGPREAAVAAGLLSSVQYVIPIHYGTFPALTGTPDKLRDALSHVEATVQVYEMKPGDTLGRG